MNNQINEDLDDLIDPKKQGQAFKKVMTGYAKPGWMIFLGFIGTAIFAVVSPMYGYFIMKTMHSLTEGFKERL